METSRADKPDQNCQIRKDVPLTGPGKYGKGHSSACELSSVFSAHLKTS